MRRIGLSFIVAMSVLLLAFGPAAANEIKQTERPLRIGVIGAGKMGGTLAAHWVRAGHEVLLSARDPEELTPLVLALGPKARLGTAREAAIFGEVVLVAVPYTALSEVGREHDFHLRDKIVIDATNPIPERDGAMAEAALKKGTGVASAEFLPGVRLVRAFNAIGHANLANQAWRNGEPVGIPYAADDKGAVRIAGQLIRDAGFDPVHVGDLSRAKEFDVRSKVFVRLLTGAQLRAELGLDKSSR